MKRSIKRIISATRDQPFLADWPRQIHHLRWADFRRLSPFSRVFGLDRGQPIDRYYIEQFLHKYCLEIRGNVLEVGDSYYTNKFGGERVSHGDVLHVVPGNPQATIVGDFATGQNIPHEAFDCIILTQVLLCIYEVKVAVANLYTALKVGGVVLATVPGICQIGRYDMERWGDYWRFTNLSAQRLFEEVFPKEHVRVENYGNVLAATAYLYGVSAGELTQPELDYSDPDYQVLITIRAVK